MNISSTAQHTRGLAVAIVVFRRIGIDTVDNHAVRLLVIEHGADVVFIALGMELCGSGTETPTVPSPETYKIAYRMAGDNTFAIVLRDAYASWK